MESPALPEEGQPFSMHARGVATFDTSQYCDGSYQFRKLLQELRDVFSSLLVMLYLQSWQAAFVVIITIASVSFFTYVGSGGAEASLDWTLVSFVVLLPQVLLLVLGFLRRESAHKDLAITRTLSLQLLWSYEGSPHRSLVRELLSALIGNLEKYLNASRFYSHEYPFTDITQRMTGIAQSRAAQARIALMAFTELARCTETSTALGIQQMKWSAKLQLACERLSIIKEYRMPQALRTLVRFYVILIIPIFYGPYYATISNSTGSFVFVVAFSVMMHLGMAVLMNATIALEDPFATDGVDGIYVEEIFYEVHKVLKNDEDSSATGGNKGPGRGGRIQAAVPPPVNSMADRGRPDQVAVDMVSNQPLPGGESPRLET